MESEYYKPQTALLKNFGHIFVLHNMTETDLRSLRRMINGACLPERQHWNSVKEAIDRLLGET